MGESPEKASASDEETSHHKIYHFGIRVSDLAAWEGKIKEHRLRLNYGGVIEYPHSRSWYVSDPSGHEIEVSYAEGRTLVFP